MQPISIYLHVPFCSHRCSYCDFNTYAGLDDLIAPYIRALEREVSIVVDHAEKLLAVHTVFFGGGTPSLLTVKNISTILGALRSNFEIQLDDELTLEANPGTVSRESLKELRECGVNRISLGAQSANIGELNLLERQHDFIDVIHAMSWAREVGFDNINLDLIFGLPYQTMQSWITTLELTLGLMPDHLSIYALSFEHGTPMSRWVDRGLLEEPDPDLAAEMYEKSSEILADAGFIQYEISNWARKSLDGRLMTCKHNLQYWRNQPYLGLGAGAHGYINNIRTSNILSPSAYIKRVLEFKTDGELEFPMSPATVNVQPINLEMEMAETMIMGMRLVEEGVSTKTFLQRFHLDLKQVYQREIEKLLSLELVEWFGENNEILRLTKRGRLLGNVVFREFV